MVRNGTISRLHALSNEPFPAASTYPHSIRIVGADRLPCSLLDRHGKHASHEDGSRRRGHARGSGSRDREFVKFSDRFYPTFATLGSNEIAGTSNWRIRVCSSDV
jgi:hypothetical protein